MPTHVFRNLFNDSCPEMMNEDASTSRVENSIGSGSNRRIP